MPDCRSAFGPSKYTTHCSTGAGAAGQDYRRALDDVIARLAAAEQSALALCRDAAAATGSHTPGAAASVAAAVAAEAAAMVASRSTSKRGMIIAPGDALGRRIGRCTLPTAGLRVAEYVHRATLTCDGPLHSYPGDNFVADAAAEELSSKMEELARQVVGLQVRRYVIYNISNAKAGKGVVLLCGGC